MPNPLRIAMFVGTFPVISETFITRQIIALLELGHEVDIYANVRPDPEQPAHPQVEKYRLLQRTTYIDAPPETTDSEMPVLPITGRTWPPGSATSVLNAARVARALPRFFRCLAASPKVTFRVLNHSEYGYQAASLSALYRLAQLCSSSKRYDVLHAHFGPVGNSFRFARELWRAPFCVSFHGYDFSTLPRKQGSDMYRKLFATADAVTVNSNYTRNQVQALGCSPDRLHKLSVGLDPAEFPFSERRRSPGEAVRMLTVARLVEIKGHEYVIRALAEVREQFPDTCYDIVGAGPLRPKIEALIGELKLQGMVKLHGALDGPAITRLLEKAHIFILASVNIEGDAEGQGLALQEAQAAGLPVVATSHGALPEGMLPGESGFLVPERDVQALAERLKYLMQHPEIWPIMGRKGRAFVETYYDIRKLTQTLVELYQSMIERYCHACTILSPQSMEGGPG